MSGPLIWGPTGPKNLNNPSAGVLTSDSNGSISSTSVLPVANGGTNNGALPVTAGGVIASDGTKLTNTGAGTSGQVLQSNGAGVPSWTTVPAVTPVATMVYGFASGTSSSPFVFATIYSDVAGAYNSSTGEFTAPVSGFYQITGNLTGGAGGIFVTAYRNGSSTVSSGAVVVGNFNSNGTADLAGLQYLAAGDTSALYPNSPVTLSGVTPQVSWNLVSASPYAAITGNYVYAHLSANATVSSGAAVIFDTVVENTLGDYNASTGIFTASVAGDYTVSFYGNTSSATNSTCFVVQSSKWTPVFGGASVYVFGTTTVNLQVGDTMYITRDLTSDWQGGTISGQNYNSWLSIKLVN